MLSGAAVGLAMQFAVADWIRGRSGSAAAADYLLTLALIVPVILAANRFVRGLTAIWSDPLALGRSTFSVVRAFTIGWLLVGGALAGVAALVEVGGRIAAPALTLLFPLAPDARLVSLLLLGLLLLDLSSRRIPDPRRFVLATACLAILGALLFVVLRKGGTDTPQLVLLQPESPLRVAALAAVGLWAVVLLRRGPKGGRSIGPGVLLTIWGAPTAVMALVALLWNAGPEEGVLLFDLMSPDSQIDLLARGAGVLLVWRAAVLLIELAHRHWRSLAASGMVPDTAVEDGRGESRSWMPWLIVAAGVGFVPGVVLAGVASLGILWSLGLAIHDGRRRAGEIGRGSVALAVSASSIAFVLPLLLPRESLLTGLGWCLLGGVLWLTWGSRHGRLAEPVDSVDLRADAGDGPVALLVVEADTESEQLLAAARALASATGHDLVVLRLVGPEESGDAVSDWELRRVEQRHVARMRRQLAGVVEGGVGAGGEGGDGGGDGLAAPLVIAKIDVSARHAIREALRDTSAELLVVGPLSGANDRRIEHLLADSSLPVIVLSGSADPPARVTVAASTGVHTPWALRLGRRLAEGAGVPCEALTIATARSTEEECTALLERLLGADADLERRVVRGGASWSEAVEAETDESDLLVLGASVDPLIGGAVLSPQLLELAGRRRALVVKAPEAGPLLPLRTLWRTLSRPFDGLGTRERATVAGAMRKAATADVDFYVLLVLASLIATVGLVLDSTATVIGAMLVAPLMSPILALAHGLVLGSAPMLHRASASILRGTGCALGVGMLVAVALPGRPPTEQMLARGQPNLLDLLVAMASGAAAAYSVSRPSLSGALPGVAISVALVPPLCVAGWAVGTSELALAGGALLLFLTNLAGIVLVGLFTFALLGVRPSRLHREERVRRALVWVAVAILVVAVPLGLQSLSSTRSIRIQVALEDALMERRLGERLLALDIRREQGLTVVECVVLGDGRDGAEVLTALRVALAEALPGIPLRVTTRLVPSLRVTSDP